MAPPARIEPPASTTASTLLALLSLRSWTAYELTQQMQRALRWVWPRSEAGIYAELKKLASADLAHAVEEDAGKRTRTRYEITDDGRAAARRWLSDTEPSPPRIEIEIVLRAFLADLAGADDLRRALAATRRQVAEQAAFAVPIQEEYLSDDAPFPERAHLNVLFMHFTTGYFEHILRWCDDVERQLDSWPSTQGVGMTPMTRAMLDDLLERERAIVVRHLPKEET